MTRLWATYRTADNGAKQVLVLTQFADTARDTTDDPEDGAEWDGDATEETEEEPRGSMPNAPYSRRAG